MPSRGRLFQLAVKDEKNGTSTVCVVVRPHTTVLPSFMVVVLLLNYSLIDIDPPCQARPQENRN